MTEDRPNPDVLLEQMQQEARKAQRGTLKVFFGMAAGVGKTYAMLEEARQRAAEGTDVVVGYAEPHIRAETEAILLGMEILPYKVVEYRGTKLKEFDLDKALSRRPTLMLVDELAHANAPGMRHEKRWQDVIELLDAGINVFSTLNVQHLESVNDIVERITGVRVRETLPDSVLEMADEVELIDIAPEELLQRFREGKVYRPDLAERAVAHFFTKGNLIALRELALRTTAQRVDAQMLAFRKANAITSPWAATERVLVCIGPSPTSRRLVRAAKRLAAGLRADFIAAYVETPVAQKLSENDRRRLEQTLGLAEQLGARTVTLSGRDVSDELLAYAQAHNVTKIVIGKSQQPRWRELIFSSMVDELVRRSGDIDVYIIRADTEEADVPAPPAVRRRWDVHGYLAAIGVCALATGIGFVLYHYLHLANENVLMLYLLGVLWVAARHSRAAAVLASVLAVAAFDFCFVPPYFTFAVSDQQYIVTFAVMLLTALLISTLTHRVRFQADAARGRERRTAALYALARDLASAGDPQTIVSSAAQQLAGAAGGRVVVLLPDGEGQLRVAADSDHKRELEEKEISVAQWASEHAQPAGRGTQTLPAADGTYLPLRAGEMTLGAMGVFASADTDSASEQRQLVEAFASQVALAIKRARAEEDARQAWERVESELLRNTLLSGVSHELRTPLAAITGAASALQESGNLNDETRRQLLCSITDEAERMERLITNLLDMTRLESGGLAIKKDWQDMREIVASAVRRMDRHLAGREVQLFLPEDLPLVQADAVALEQVLTNLFDNAIQYTPAGSPLEIRASSDGELMIEVSDHGPGLVPGTEKKVFEKFFRAQPGGANRRGIGLGLAICKGIIEAHGGTVAAMNRAGGGAVFRFTLPLPKHPPQVNRHL